MDAVLADMASWPQQGIAGNAGLQSAAAVAPFMDVQLTEASSWLGMESGIPMHDTLQGNLTPEASSPSSQNEPPMPSMDVLLDLIDVFFERFYQNLPIIHRGKLVSRLKNYGFEGVPCILLYAIMTLASGAHANPQIRENQPHWRALARAAFKKLLPTEKHPLETLQAAVILIFDAPLQGDYPVTWVMLGEAWRKAAVIGYHQVDAEDNEVLVQYLGTVAGLNWVEREECRRVVWMFFILDRGLCYPIGMVHAVDDRRMVINFPMREEDFQGAEEPTITAAAVAPILTYTHNLDRLITRVEEHGRRKAGTTLHYIILAYVLLGRVTEEVYSRDPEYQERKEVLDSLVERLVHIRLILPGYATDLGVADARDVPYVIWLSAVMSVSTIFLHHRPLRRHNGVVVNADDVAANWPHAVLTARNTVQLLRDGFRSGSSASIILAHTATAVFVCTRALIMEYMCPQQPAAATSESDSGGKIARKRRRDAAIRADLEVLAAASMQVHSSLGMLARKFIAGFKFHIRLGEDATREGMEGGARNLLKRCGDWAAAEDEEDIIIPE